jgi:hypothetical protein
VIWGFGCEMGCITLDWVLGLLAGLKLGLVPGLERFHRCVSGGILTCHTDVDKPSTCGAEVESDYSM